MGCAGIKRKLAGIEPCEHKLAATAATRLAGCLHSTVSLLAGLWRPCGTVEAGAVEREKPYFLYIMQPRIIMLRHATT